MVYVDLATGRLIDRDRPELTDAGTLEGDGSVIFHEDAVELKVCCYHCGGLVVQVGRAPKWLLSTDSGKKRAYSLTVEKARRNHQCALIDDGKDTFADFERKVLS